MESRANQIHFVFVGRLKDTQLLLSTLSNPTMQDRLQDFTQHATIILQKQACQVQSVDGQRLKSDFTGLSWHSICDKNSILYGAVTDKDYPDDLCSQFLRQLIGQLYDKSIELRRDPQSQETLRELQQHKGIVHELHQRYRDSRNIDKSLQALQAIDKAQGFMQQNIASMIQNRQQMFDIESKSGDLRDTASKFKSQSKKMERMARLKQMQMKVIFALLAVTGLVLLYYFMF
ncbi:hypothetical protein FGO68_gene9057 [Halteria grandinella]|uniref:V-SNARE coiled-coil homology domain-containing protein n=1 Tax=Halteria grandinella TaxID=5974 RepID=A0A8J8NK73_HALGN|nr:hypothetical protein FGO68_gene9057 [Halteria grandinella]